MYKKNTDVLVAYSGLHYTNMPTKSKNLHTPKYYELHRDEACILIADQLSNGWKISDVTKYFILLGYDYLFVRQLVNPLLVQRGHGNLWN